MYHGIAILCQTSLTSLTLPIEYHINMLTKWQEYQITIALLSDTMVPSHSFLAVLQILVCCYNLNNFFGVQMHP